MHNLTFAKFTHKKIEYVKTIKCNFYILMNQRDNYEKL